jgi:hypothetical protein
MDADGSVTCSNSQSISLIIGAKSNILNDVGCCMVCIAVP